MKYKVDDVILIEHDEKSYVHQIVEIERDWAGYLYTMVYLGGDHDNSDDMIGSHMMAPQTSTDEYAHVQLAFDKIDIWITDVDGQHRCRCDKFQVVHFGCKCGGC